MSPFNGRHSLELNGDIAKTIDKEGENHFLGAKNKMSRSLKNQLTIAINQNFSEGTEPQTI